MGVEQPKDKAVFLRQAGALNRQPDRISDDEFLASDFFDPLDLVQVKYEMVRRVQRDGQKVSKAAKAFGMSRTSYYQAQAALDRHGIPGLLPQRPGPREAHKLRPEIVDFIEQRMADVGPVGSRELGRLIQEHFGLTVHPRSIERALARRKKKLRDASP